MPDLNRPPTRARSAAKLRLNVVSLPLRSLNAGQTKDKLTFQKGGNKEGDYDLTITRRRGRLTPRGRRCSVLVNHAMEEFTKDVEIRLRRRLLEPTTMVGGAVG